MKRYFNRSALTKLDVRGAIGLEHLVCARNDALVELNLSGLTELITVTCFSNKALTKIDLSGLSKLTNFNCEGNALTAIDLSGLSALTNFMGKDQSISLMLAGDTTNDWSLAVPLNNPMFGEATVSYANGVLTSTNNTVHSTTFTAYTGAPGKFLSGTLNFSY